MNRYSEKIKNAVLNQIVLDNFDHTINYPEFHIAFGVDKKFVAPMGVLLTSLLDQNKDVKLSIHIFLDEIEPEDKERLEKVSQIYHIRIILYFVKNEIFFDLNKAQFTIAAYYRFLIPQTLEAKTDRFLYLDADMVCIHKLDELAHLNFDDKIVCAVEDHKVTKEDSPHLNLKGNLYFNSGMLYIDVKKWNQMKISEQCLELLEQRSFEFACFDQDALNIILEGQVKYISVKWNYLCNTGNKDFKNIVQVPKDTIIIHYIGFNKPWHCWCYHPLAEYFKIVLRKSLWKEVCWIHTPKKYREMKMMSVACYHERRYIKAAYWGIKAGLKKLGDKLK